MDVVLWDALVSADVPLHYFIGVKISEEEDSRIFYSKLGAFGKPDKFLALMLKLSGLE
jgi:hypothetical protein